MRKFSLCFNFPDNTEKYLIPELLGKEEPDEVKCFKPEECLNFEYHYGVLPEGLLPRFIVRSHHLSEGQKRWRSGAILIHENCKALVVAEATSRKVLVRVKGKNAGARRRLLALVRYDLDRINSEFKDRLDAQAKVPLPSNPTFCVDYAKLAAFELKEVREFPECVDDEVITINVSDLLNGVDLETVVRSKKGDSIMSPKSIFISYSHKDENLRNELDVHLKLLARQSVISTWHDRKILPGTEWNHEIDDKLLKANIIILLVSADFIASDYVWENEVATAMRRHEAGEAVVVPIMARACDWNTAPFAKLQGLPKDMVPITSWQNRDAAWTDVAKGIRSLAEQNVLAKAN